MCGCCYVWMLHQPSCVFHVWRAFGMEFLALCYLLVRTAVAFPSTMFLRIRCVPCTSGLQFGMLLCGNRCEGASRGVAVPAVSLRTSWPPTLVWMVALLVWVVVSQMQWQHQWW
jgi:hypothetical protein